MRIYDNGVYRDATQEEIEAAEAVIPPDDKQTVEERIAELEEELAATRILLGVDE